MTETTGSQDGASHDDASDAAAPHGGEGEPETVEVSVHELAGGTEAFLELVDRFYDRVEQDEVLRPVYPEDLEPGKRALGLFLAQYWGGPRTYAEERGHPRLRMRHAPFAVTPDGAERWAFHMIGAIRSMEFHELVEQALLEYVVRFTPGMVNTLDTPEPPDA